MNRPSSSSSALAAACFASLVACTAPDGSSASGGASVASAATRTSRDLTPNDVSILLPFELVTGDEARVLRMADRPDPGGVAPGRWARPDDGEPFVPAWAIEEIDGRLAADVAARTAEGGLFGLFPTRPTPFQAAAPRARMVSLRIDPCANLLEARGDDALCRHELRLVFQPLREAVASEPRRFDDMNVHAIYDLTRAEFAEVVETLRAEKLAAGFDYDAAPLDEQPAIARQGAGGSYLAAVHGLVHRFARGRALRSLAAFGDVDNVGLWPMIGFDIVDGRATREPLRHLALQEGEPTREVQYVRDAHLMFTPPEPASDAPDGMFTHADMQLAYANRVRIEDPATHNLRSLDCASCHTARIQAGQLKTFASVMGVPLAEPEPRFASSRWNLAPSAKAEAAYARRPQSLQIFSFSVRDVAVDARTIHESAVVADYVNAHYTTGGTGATGPTGAK